METIESKHTLGPWEAELYLPHGSADGVWRVQKESNGDVLAIVDPEDAGHEDDSAEANARLIAAAPELLQALSDLYEQLHQHMKLDVKKHYLLLVADAAASKALFNARGSVQS